MADSDGTLATKRPRRASAPTFESEDVTQLSSDDGYDSDEEVVIQHNWQELRRLMWDYVGIVRTSRRLDYAADRIALLEREVSGYYARFQIPKPLVEMRNLARVAQLMVQCARGRQESRGLHYNSDFPNAGPIGHDSVLIPPHFDQASALSGRAEELPAYRE